MLLSPVFYWDTLHILRAHASTIHTLHVHEVNLGTDERYYVSWDQILKELQFPLLERFTFTGPPMSKKVRLRQIRFGALLSFLERHPKITYLELLNVPTYENPILTFTKEAPYLPNLRTLVARNDVAGHILQRPCNFEHLELLHLWPQPTPSWHAHPIISPGPGRALVAIASNVSHPISIELGLAHADDCFRWMNEDANIPRKLPQVHGVGILLVEDMAWDNDILLPVLPEWLGLFPSVKKVWVEGNNMYEAETLHAAIHKLCPRLQHCAIPRAS